jgi:hypothetical protein
MYDIGLLMPLHFEIMLCGHCCPRAAYEKQLGKSNNLTKENNAMIDHLLEKQRDYIAAASADDITI